MQLLKILFRLTQFLPLTLFLYVASRESPQNWPLAFEVGALTAIIEFAVLIPIFKTQLSRLIAGVNVFLIFGGSAFYFNIQIFKDLLSFYRESSLLLSIFAVCIFATFTTYSGIFEIQFAPISKQKKFSYYYLLLCFIVFGFSYLNRGNSFLAGTAPVVCLILMKYFMGKYLARSTSSTAT